MSKRQRVRTAARPRSWTAIAAAAILVGLAGCGGEGSSKEAAIEERIAEERADAAQRARQSEKIKDLQRDLRALERSEDSPAQSSTAPPTSADLTFQAYSSPTGGWRGEVPAGGGWSAGVETDINPGLHRTTFTGPGGAVLIVDSTPGERPVYSGSAARSAATHPIFGNVEKLVFRGNTSVTPCETATCVDYLIPAGDGGYAVLAGGSGDFAQLGAIAEAAMVSLRPYAD